jgi:CHAT domain-containing protein
MARLSFARAERAGTSGDELKGQAALLAAEGVTDALQVQDPGARAELLGRLLEQAVDAGLAGQPMLNTALKAMSEAAGGDKGVEAAATALTGRLWLAKGDRARAAALFREAAFLESQRNQPLRLPDWFLLLARAEPEKRDAHILQAYRALEAVRPLLPARDPLTEESTFSLHMRPVFEAAVEVQLAGSASSSESEQIAGAQRIIEAFRQAEIQSTLGSNCVPPRDPVKPADLRPGEILLYPILLEDRVELIFAERVDGGDPTYKRIAQGARVGRRTVARLVAAMANSVAYGSDDGWRDGGRQLYDILIKPLEARLRAGSTLIIVPDAPLRPLPFAALLAADGKFLVEKTRLSIAPALSYSEPGVEHEKAPLVVAASLERDVSLPSGFFPALLGAETEAKVAAGVEANVRAGVFLEDFRREELARAMAANRPQVLHLATHAAFNGRSDRSFIVANGSAIPISELRGLLSGSRSRGELLDLIVLSACETAVGDDQASMGLAGAAVQAGARSAIASLWQVSDAGTVELMRGFYRNYRAGQGKAEALRNAQLALISKGGEFADPSIWAAFTLLGGWR